MLISFYFCSVYWKKSTMGLNILHVLAEYARLQRLVRGSEVSAASHSRPRGDYMYPIPLLQKGRQLICLSFATMFDACKKKKSTAIGPRFLSWKAAPCMRKYHGSPAQVCWALLLFLRVLHLWFKNPLSFVSFHKTAAS